MRCRETAQGDNRAHPGDTVSHLAPLLIALAAAVRRGGVWHPALRVFQPDGVLGPAEQSGEPPLALKPLLLPPKFTASSAASGCTTIAVRANLRRRYGGNDGNKSARPAGWLGTRHS